MLRAMLQRAVKHNRGEMTVDDLPGLINEGRMGVMVDQADNPKLALAFEIIVYPRRRLLHVAFAAGRGLRQLFDDPAALTSIATLFGANAVSCHCRPAMARYLKRFSPLPEPAYLTLEWKVTP